MKLFAGIWLMVLCVTTTTIGASQPPADTLLLYFRQVEEATFKHRDLWDKDIYGPILIVDPETREIYANQPDAGNLLALDRGIYRGFLPAEVTISNTDTEWSGTHWAMLKLPLPEDQYDRVDLITHELFHVAQPLLNIQTRREENSHLDLREGRIYLRLEMAALEAALKSQRINRAEEHLRNALIFRKYRHTLYRGSETTENSLELLEGLATYTGQIMSGRDKWQWRTYLIQRVSRFKELPTFVRSFAYETVPVYGFFLYQKDNYWHKKVDEDTRLTDLFSEAWGVENRILLQSYVRQVAEEYRGREIVDEEMKRELSNDVLLDLYRKRFFEQPRLEIRLEQMHMSFDPRNLVPLDEDEGTVYPTLTLSDHWGILTVESGGALLRNDWRWIIVSEPIEITGRKITGAGWVIELNEGYLIRKNREGVYQISKEITDKSPPKNR